MDFDNMKKDKDFQKMCFDTDLVSNKNWFNLENGSGDEVYIAYEAWVAGQQSKQAEVDELQKRIDDALVKISNHYHSCVARKKLKRMSASISEISEIEVHEFNMRALKNILKGDQL